MSDSSQPKPGIPQDVAQKYDEELVNPPPQTESAPVSTAELKAGAAERAKNRPLLQKILAVFQKEKGSYRELIINSEPLDRIGWQHAIERHRMTSGRSLLNMIATFTSERT